MSVYLICLKEPDPEVLASIREEWPDDRYEVSDTQILVVKPNGGESVYDRIEKHLGADFHVLIVRTRYYHGRHNVDLWEWLESHAQIG